MSNVEQISDHKCHHGDWFRRGIVPSALQAMPLAHSRGGSPRPLALTFFFHSSLNIFSALSSNLRARLRTDSSSRFFCCFFLAFSIASFLFSSDSVICYPPASNFCSPFSSYPQTSVPFLVTKRAIPSSLSCVSLWRLFLSFVLPLLVFCCTYCTTTFGDTPTSCYALGGSNTNPCVLLKDAHPFLPFKRRTTAWNRPQAPRPSAIWTETKTNTHLSENHSNFWC